MILDFLLSLNFFEAILLISLFTSSFYQIYKSYSNQNWVELFKPINLFALLTIFYCVIGPILSSANGDGSIAYRGIDHRQYYQIGLLAALISFFSFQIGFDYKNNFLIKDFGFNKKNYFKEHKKDFLVLFKWGERIFAFALICQFIVLGFGLLNYINFLGSFNLNQANVINTGNLQGYFSYTINFTIFAILLMFISILNGNKNIYKLIFYILITLSIFISYGFRWRLFMLLFPAFCIYYFYKKAKPNFLILTSLILSTFLVFGIIQLSRTYQYGISLEQFAKGTKSKEGSNLNFILKSAFFETNVFNTSAAMISKTPSENNYIGIRPLIVAISIPIPRKIWPDKPTGDYILSLYKKIYPGYLAEVGAASLGFAEYYISGGWIALVSINFFLGYFYKRLWIWFFCNFYDPLAQINYALYMSFIFIIYSRGYALQIVFLYLSIFTPLLLVSYLWNKRFSL